VRRREFLRLLALAAASGAALRAQRSEAQAADELYGSAEIRQREPAALHRFARAAPAAALSRAERKSRRRRSCWPPSLTSSVPRCSSISASASAGALAHAHTHLDFAQAARRYGKIGGFAHLATLIRRLRGDRPQALLLDGGDSWQGSATSLWTQGADMIGAQKRLGVDYTTGHWEFTYGAERVRQAVRNELPPVEFLAQNVKTADFEEPVFKPYALRSVNGVALAVIGQAFPYTPIANPRPFRRRVDVRHPGSGAAEDDRRSAQQGGADRRSAFA
jgi:sulfur-oxidizing protein SoxB